MEENDYLVIGNEEEVRKYKRTIDFKYVNKKNINKTNTIINENIDVNFYYNKLSDYQKKIVDTCIDNLLKKNQDYLGYNLRQINNWFSMDSVNYSMTFKIAFENYKRIKNLDKKEIYRSEFETNDQFQSALNNINFEGKNSKEINVSSNKQFLDILKNLQYKSTFQFDNYSKTGVTLDILCRQWMISKELLINGEGYIYTVDPKEYQTDDFKKYINHINNSQEQYLTKTTMDFMKYYEKYLKENYGINSKRAKIIEKQYAKIKKNGKYYLLKEFPKNKEKLKCINELIIMLYFCQ